MTPATAERIFSGWPDRDVVRLALAIRSGAQLGATPEARAEADQLWALLCGAITAELRRRELDVAHPRYRTLVLDHSEDPEHTRTLLGQALGGVVREAPEYRGKTLVEVEDPDKEDDDATR